MEEGPGGAAQGFDVSGTVGREGSGSFFLLKLLLLLLPLLLLLCLTGAGRGGLGGILHHLEPGRGRGTRAASVKEQNFKPVNNDSEIKKPIQGSRP